MDKLAFILFLFLCFGLTAQEPMRVTRSAALDRSAPIFNIFVDDNNNKWVGNELGVFQVLTVDYASPMEKEDEYTSLLQYPDGNYNLLWNKESLFRQMREDTDGLFEGDIDITSMFYDEGNKELWIGTKGIGVFRFDMSGPGELIENMNMDNSKLRTDMINTMICDRPGSYWIATEEGVLHNNGRKWKVYEPYVNIEALAVSMDGVWVFGEGYLWKVDAAETWEEIELKESFSEGKIKDIAFDSRGRMWIASEIITRYNPELGTVEKFGAAEYFTSDFPSAIAVDQDDAIWVGTEDKGLYLIEKATAMTISCILDKAPSCDGQNDAALKVIVSGGVEPYTYQWNKDLNGKNPKDLAPGKYQVTVTDSKGKSEVSGLQINDPAITVSVEQVRPESAPGVGDGVASVTVSGGQGNYTYKWQNGSTDPKIENLSAGEYSITVSDEGACSSVATVAITQEAAPLTLALEQTQVITCVGSPTAALKAKISGGRAPFQFAWSNDLSGEAPKNIPAGNYALTITDSEGTSANASITIEDAPDFIANILVDAPASTGNADGKASVKVTGGTEPFSFQWDNGEKSATAVALAPGERSITVTDANGCTTNATVSIDENILPLSVSIEQSQVIKCPGQAQAALNTQVRGGKGPFQFKWSKDLSGEAPKNIPAGNYALTITDSEGTSANASIIIEDAPDFIANILVDAPASTGNADGKASVKVTGGTEPFSFQWDNGEKSATAVALAPGERSITVTDANGCTTNATVSIDENILPLSVSIEQSQVIKCSGQAQAALNAQVRGGKGPFQFKWSNDLSGEAPKNIPAGNYALTITDSEGTSANASIIIEDAPDFIANILVDAPASTGNADGKATVKVDGGTQPFSFQWDNGEKSATAVALAPGERSITVTDANGCTTNATVSIDENILPLSVSIEQSQVIKCSGQAQAALSAQVRGGKGPFEFAWSDDNLAGEAPLSIPAGNYSLTVTDSEGTSATSSISIEEPKTLTADILVDAPASTDNTDGKATVKVTGGTEPFSFQWDNGEKSATAVALAPGERSVTVTDANGCTTNATVSIDENILPLSVSIEQSQVIKCSGQAQAALSAQVRGGKGPFEFAWSDDNLAGEAPLSIPAGNYSLTVTDSEGTSATSSISIEEPKTLTADILVDAPASTDNTDGKATVKVTGGTGPFSFQWDNGEKSATAVALAPGERSITVTDANGCTTNATVSIDENILPLSVSIEQSQVIKCSGQAQAALSAQVRGGKGPFEFAWSDDNLAGEAPLSIPAGEYSLTVTDSEGTSATSSISIEEPKTLTADILIDAPASTDNADGKATVKVDGGTEPFSFQWDNGEKSATAVELAPGERSVTVTDANGCTINATVSIDENILPLSVNIEQSQDIKCQGETTALNATVRGGKGPFQYEWDNDNLSGASPSGLSAGAYNLTITDALGTQATAAISISEPTALSAAIIKNGRVSKPGNQDGLAEVEISGGTPPYEIAWDNGETGNLAKTLAIGKHGVTVSDANECSTNLNFETKKTILPELNLATLRTGQNIRMEELFFEADSFRITPQSIPVLDEVYDFLKENTAVEIEVGGHTNNIPETAFCDYLSEERAKSVANYIVRKGINPQRVFYKGYGKRKPISSNRTAEGRARNQRVEIKILNF